MLKKILGLAPKLEDDGSYAPSKVALKLAVPAKSDYKKISYQKYQGPKSKILVICTEQKNMKMKNGKYFSTGNHPVETILPMLHLKEAGFDFDVVTPNGDPVIFEMWAMPNEDKHVLDFYKEYEERFKNPESLVNFIENLTGKESSYAAIFIPGGHGAMLGIPEDKNVGKILHWAHNNNLFTITLCHGPGSLLSTALDGKKFIYSGYQMTVFPDSVDRQTPLIGYLPGHMPWKLCEKLSDLGVSIINKKSDNSTFLDRNLITGASPLAANELGILAANTLLNELNNQ